MNNFITIFLILLLIIPVLVLAKEEQTQFITFGNEDVVGSIDDPLIHSVIGKTIPLLDGIISLQRSLLNEIQVADKEKFEYEINYWD